MAKQYNQLHTGPNKFTKFEQNPLVLYEELRPQNVPIA